MAGVLFARPCSAPGTSGQPSGPRQPPPNPLERGNDKSRRNAMGRGTAARAPRLLAVLGALAIWAAAGTAIADDYPSKPVRLLVPFPPGGAVDIVARTIADELGRTWGQPLVIENR